MYIDPPKVTHLHCRAADERQALCQLCGAALHMSKGEIKLLRYYAEQQNGFKPALQHIANTLEMNRSQIFRNRRLLEQHGVILVQDDRVYIDWQRIRLFSTLDPALTSKRCYAAPVKPEKCNYKVYTFPRKLFFFTAPPEQVCAWFAAIDEETYGRFCKQVQRYRLAAMEKAA